MKKLFVLSILVLFCVGCQTTATQKGALFGGLGGAAVGQMVGGNTESTLIGAGAGALLGGLGNDYVDQQKKNSYNQGVKDAQQYSKTQDNSQEKVYTKKVKIEQQPIQVTPPPVEYEIQMKQK